MNLEEYKGVFVFAQQVDNEDKRHRIRITWQRQKRLARFKYRSYSSSYRFKR